MKKLKFPLFILLITVFVCIFGSAKAQNTEMNINLKDFDKLQIGNAFVIEVRKAAQFSIKAVGDKENLDKIDSYVKDGELRIKYKGDNKWRNEIKGSVSLYITMPELQEVSFSGATKSTVDGFSVKGTFKLELSGASESKINLQAENIDIELSGASNAVISGGKPFKMSVEVSGASKLNAYEFEAKSVKITTSGASSAKIAVSSVLNADATGASSIKYRGNPDLNYDTSGASRISKD